MKFHTLAIGLMSIALSACTAAIVTNDVPAYDFEQTGALIRNAEGLTPGMWYLKYENPGTPGLTMRLSFDAETLCIDRENRGPCTRSQFENNLAVRIWGMRDADGVRVKEMRIEQIN